MKAKSALSIARKTTLPGFIGLAALLQAGMASAQPAPETHFKIDPAHSFAQFDISHLGTSRLIGRFDTVSGSFIQSPAGGTVSVMIPVSSLDTNNAARDKHLKSPDFFNAAQFPEMTFIGRQAGEQLVGNLTLHGVTRQVSFRLKKIGEGKDPWGGYRSGYEARTIIKRSDFGMRTMLPAVGDEVQLRVNLEGTRD